MPKRSQLTIADVQGMTFPELERFHRQGYDYSDYKDLTVMYALQDKIRKDKAFFASDASEKTKQSYAKAKEAKDEKMMKIIIDAWYKKHKNHFNAERAAGESMNAQIQAIRNQQAKNNAASAAQKQAQANFAARTNRTPLQDMNTCAELEQGLQEIYAELMLYKPVSDDDMFLHYLEGIKEGVQSYVDDVKSGKVLRLSSFTWALDHSINDALDSHMTSARLGEKAEWGKNDRMIEYILTKKFKPLVMKLVEACKKPAAGGKRTRKNSSRRRTTRKN